MAYFLGRGVSLSSPKLVFCILMLSRLGHAEEPAALPEVPQSGEASPSVPRPGPSQSPAGSVQSTVQPGAEPAMKTAEPPPPTIDLRPEPVEASVARTDRTHDGFYARLSLGFGTLGTTVNMPGTGASPKADGDTIAIDVAAGYSPSRGIALGGMFLFESLPSGDFGGEPRISSNVGTMLIGPFFDGFPNARGGFHAGGVVGLAQDRLSRIDVAGFTRARGFGIAGWVGYDLWVAEQWSVGGLLRLMGTRGTADVNDARFAPGEAEMATQSIQIMLTTLYH